MRESSVRNINRIGVNSRKRTQKRIVFSWNKRENISFLNFIGDYNNILAEDQFSMLLEAEADKIEAFNGAFQKHVTGYMDIGGFAQLLKDLGVSAASIEEVRSKIAASHVVIKLSIDNEIDGARAEPVSEKPVIGKHSARIQHERRETPAPEPDGTALPRSFEEAKAQVPGLRKWVEIKRDNPGRPVYDIVLEHLQNEETGLGKWVNYEGLPKKSLRGIDESLRQEILSIEPLPADIKLLDGRRGRPRSEETLTGDQIREARRIAALASRRGI